MASNAWAVQILEVAFSRRMCCSRVCSARRSATAPCASRETPTSRPGISRLSASRVARKAACGPPKPIGTPKRCAEPTTMSAPIAPGGRSSTRASGSAATMASAPARCAASISAERSRTSPVLPGYCRTTAKGLAAVIPATSPGAKSSSTIPCAARRVASTARLCGWRSAATATRSPSRASRAGRAARAMCTASAIAVASSSSEALAISMPESSMIRVWKASRSSSLPCAISG